MKRRPARNRFTWLLALIAGTPLFAAITPTEWSQRQSLQVAAPGLVRVDLTPATFDAAAAQQEDLRVVDANGSEIASLLDDPPVPQAHTVRPTSFEVKLDGTTTVITLATGTQSPLTSVTLESPHPFFMRAARVEISDDGDHWTTLDQGLPLFRQWGAEKLELPLGQHSAAYVRVVVSDHRAASLPFTNARLNLTAGSAPALLPVGAKITRRDEFAGETVLTLALDGRHLPLAALELETKEPLFTRRVTVTVREVRDAVPGERTVGSGTLYRVALDGAPSREQLELPLNFTPLTREVLVHIHNGDSPPLALAGVRLKRWPVSLLFMAPAAGKYLLLSGNPQARAPQYDLAGFAGEMRSANVTPVVPGDLEATPNYQPRESLAVAPMADVPLTGAPLDVKEWRQRRSILIQRTGVQELELDFAALGRTARDFRDLRIVREGNQIPYVLEQPALSRALSLQPASVADPKRPSVSLWRLQLPQRGARVQQVVLASLTALFQRNFSIYEVISPDTPSDEDLMIFDLKTTVGMEFASGSWSRTPEPSVAATRTFEFSKSDSRVRTETLWIETDNGDNPPIALGSVQVVYPVVRLIFKADQTDGFSLVYGNRQASQPHYDLSLVADRLLTVPRNVAKLSDAGVTTSAPEHNWLKSSYIFWAALALVVIVLLVVVAKLLPKPPAT